MGRFQAWQYFVTDRYRSTISVAHRSKEQMLWHLKLIEEEVLTQSAMYVVEACSVGYRMTGDKRAFEPGSDIYAHLCEWRGRSFLKGAKIPLERLGYLAIERHFTKDPECASCGGGTVHHVRCAFNLVPEMRNEETCAKIGRAMERVCDNLDKALGAHLDELD